MVEGTDTVQDNNYLNYIRRSRGGLVMWEDMVSTIHRIQYGHFLEERIDILKTSKKTDTAAEGGSDSERNNTVFCNRQKLESKIWLQNN